MSICVWRHKDVYSPPQAYTEGQLTTLMPAEWWGLIAVAVEVQRREGSSHLAPRKHFLERKGTLNCICKMGKTRRNEERRCSGLHASEGDKDGGSWHFWGLVHDRHLHKHCPCSIISKNVEDNDGNEVSLLSRVWVLHLKQLEANRRCQGREYWTEYNQMWLNSCLLVDFWERLGFRNWVPKPSWLRSGR